MKILYCWEGKNPLPQEREEAIEETISIYPDAKYYCITKLPYFISDKFNIIDWDLVRYEMIRFYGFDSPLWDNYMHFSDWARFWYLSEVGNTLWLDTDCRMKKYFDFETQEKLIHAENEICLMYSPKNGNGGELVETIKAYVKRPGLLFWLSRKFDKSWSGIIPQEYFKHK